MASSCRHLPSSAPDCGQNPGGFSGLEPELLHSRLTATERLWLIYAYVLIDQRQLSPGRRASSPQKKRPNKQLKQSWASTLHTQRLASEAGSRFAFPPAGFVWFCLDLFLSTRPAHISKYRRCSLDSKRASSPNTVKKWSTLKEKLNQNLHQTKTPRCHIQMFPPARWSTNSHVMPRIKDQRLFRIVILNIKIWYYKNYCARKITSERWK